MIKIVAFLASVLLFIPILITPILFFWLYFLPAPLRSKAIRPIVKLWCNVCFLKLLAIDLHTELTTKKFKGTTLIISNHQSFIDIGILMTLYRCGFILKKSLSYTPFGWIAALVGSVSLERSSLKSFMLMLKKCAKRIQQKEVICFFPEGTRSKTGELLPFKKGILNFFYKKNIPTLILAQYGTADILPHKSWLPRLGKKVVILECGFLLPQDYASCQEFTSVCYQKIQQNVQKAKIMQAQLKNNAKASS